MLDVAAIRRAHPIAEVIAGAGVALHQSGQRLVGRCPLHADREPSLAVYPRTQSYFCYGCEAGGDVIDFVARRHSLGFLDAVAWLGGNAAPPAAGDRQVVRLLEREETRERSRAETHAIEVAVALYARQLEGCRPAQDYLRERGISPDAAGRLRVGYARGGLAHALRAGGGDCAAAHAVGLLRRDGADTMRGRIVIPELAPNRRATWLSGRAIPDREPRYLNPRLPLPLLGLGRVRGERVIVTEGPFDWLTAAAWRLPVVALLGTHASRDALAALRRFRQVYLAFDADDAGRAAAARLAAALGPRAIAVELPAGRHDVNELGRLRGGREAFLRALRAAHARKEEQRWQSTMDRARSRRAA